MGFLFGPWTEQGRQKTRSSRPSGVGGLGLEGVGGVVEFVGHLLDDLDAVIDASEDAGVEWGSGQDKDLRWLLYEKVFV